MASCCMSAAAYIAYSFSRLSNRFIVLIIDMQVICFCFQQRRKRKLRAYAKMKFYLAEILLVFELNSLPNSILLFSFLLKHIFLFFYLRKLLLDWFSISWNEIITHLILLHFAVLCRSILEQRRIFGLYIVLVRNEKFMDLQCSCLVHLTKYHCIIDLCSCYLLFVGGLEWHGPGESKGVHFKLPGLSFPGWIFSFCPHHSTIIFLHSISSSCNIFFVYMLTYL